MNDIISEVRSFKNGARVTINDQLILHLTKKDLRSFAYREGDSVDADELRHTLLLEQYPDALNRAVRLLAVRARSSYEIEKRLTDACYMADTVEMVLTKLQTEGLLNDLAFAEQWVRERSARQIGKVRLLYELRNKGIEDDLAERAIAQLSGEQQDAEAGKLAEKLQRKYRNLPAADARRKTILAMQRRGYAYGDALRAMEQTAEEDETET